MKAIYMAFVVPFSQTTTCETIVSTEDRHSYLLINHWYNAHANATVIAKRYYVFWNGAKDEQIRVHAKNYYTVKYIARYIDKSTMNRMQLSSYLVNYLSVFYIILQLQG
jgi:hypothetical protein